MSGFPLPVRVAAGLAATAVEQARSLPTTLLGLPVTVASQTLQASMRVQQHITELAIKGDEALSALRTPEEQPSWATFDEDVVPEPAPAPVAEPKPEGTSLLAEYDEMSLPQLRGRLRSFSEADLVELLAHEERTAQRPEHVRMLTNRLTRLREQ
ncbi:lipid droplet-associated protein [Saccharopolyspora rhizosphaerae]|uniref:Lipid droplet-associated protein n=1 Tax=Saccharopolyspora rhizosphaerae TaxID=2492662 RepID=A0A426JQW3_9PSEU|nr:lipid droplet-associated protein [Saccharopolyspora rhizosphaerae]RRO15536.1 lipid droplet-associated protein [Saccharopolyspora rhizosphaerae]